MNGSRRASTGGSPRRASRRASMGDTPVHKEFLTPKDPHKPKWGRLGRVISRASSVRLWFSHQAWRFTQLMRSSNASKKVTRKTILIKDEEKIFRNKQRTKRVHFRLPKPKAAKVLQPIDHDSPWIQRWTYAMVRPTGWFGAMRCFLLLTLFAGIRCYLSRTRSGLSPSGSRSVSATRGVGGACLHPHLLFDALILRMHRRKSGVQLFCALTNDNQFDSCAGVAEFNGIMQTDLIIDFAFVCDAYAALPPSPNFVSSQLETCLAPLLTHLFSCLPLPSYLSSPLSSLSAPLLCITQHRQMFNENPSRNSPGPEHCHHIVCWHLQVTPSPPLLHPSTPRPDLTGPCENVRAASISGSSCSGTCCPPRSTTASPHSRSPHPALRGARY